MPVRGATLPWVALGLLAAAAAPARAQGPEDPQQLVEMSLADLLSIDVRVTSASRKAQALDNVPSAVTVLRGADLVRAGIRTIPEALRFVPGMTVQRLDANRWAVSARGFADQFADNMLVLIDGRTVYTPLFSGVWWDIQDLPMEDIDRIEVIRGPAGVSWGSNAVNAVINVITKNAGDTQGSQITTRLGSTQSEGNVRYGDTLGEDGHFRTFARWRGLEANEAASGGSADDSAGLFSAGFRADLGGGEGDAWHVQARVYDGTGSNRYEIAALGPPYTFAGAVDHAVQGGHMLGRWARTLAGGGELSAQVYWDHTERSVTNLFSEQRDTFDFELQHRFEPAEGHDMVWGLGARHTRSKLEDSPIIGFQDLDRSMEIFSAFAEDEIALSDSVSLLVGARLEDTEFAGPELLPTVRALWRASEHRTLWAGVSRAVRTPSQADQDLDLIVGVIPGAPGPDTHITYLGRDGLSAGSLVAFEAGWREQLDERLSIDVATFYNRYDDLISYEPGAPFVSGPNVVAPFYATNFNSADSYGIELATHWNRSEIEQWSAGWWWIEIDVDVAGSGNPDPLAGENKTPPHQAYLRWERDLDEAWRVGATLWWVDALGASLADSWIRGDLQATWRPKDGVEVGIGAHDLLHDGDAESGPSIFNPTALVESGVYLEARWSS